MVGCNASIRRRRRRRRRRSGYGTAAANYGTSGVPFCSTGMRGRVW